MKEAVARARFVRVSPLRARLVINEIRGKSVEEARRILALSPKRAAQIIAKVLSSAVANAEHNFDMDPKKLWVAKAFVDEGPRLKRLNPRAFGRADIIQRRLSHITIVVGELED